LFRTKEVLSISGFDSRTNVDNRLQADYTSASLIQVSLSSLKDRESRRSTCSSCR